MKKKNNLKKGFTLIELLAVIVILAVIALIAVPQILNILNKARLNAAKDSTYGIVKAAESYTTNFMLENNGTIPSGAIEFECDNTGCNLTTSLIGYNLTGLDKLDFKGTKPTSGTIRISNNGKTVVAENLQMNGFNCNYANDKATCTKGNGSETNNPTTPVEAGPTSEIPTGDGYTGVLKIVYLDPTDLTKECNESNINSDTETKGGCMKWYAYDEDATAYTMILDHNTTASVSWALQDDYIEAGGTDDFWSAANALGPITAEKQLKTDTTGWDSSLEPRLIRYDEIFDITGSTALDSNYEWLFDRTNSACTDYGCLNNATGTNASSTYGYWTQTPVSDTPTFAWNVGFDGYLNCNYVGTPYGVRPVITIQKSNIS